VRACSRRSWSSCSRSASVVERFELVHGRAVARVRLLEHLLAPHAHQRILDREPGDIDTATLVGDDGAITRDGLQARNPFAVRVDLTLQ
jgi:hypothetical protein